MKLEFTKEKPTEAGWYVVRVLLNEGSSVWSRSASGYFYPEIVQVIKRDSALQVLMKHVISIPLCDIGDGEVEWCRIEIGE